MLRWRFTLCSSTWAGEILLVAADWMKMAYPTHLEKSASRRERTQPDQRLSAIHMRLSIIFSIVLYGSSLNDWASKKVELSRNSCSGWHVDLLAAMITVPENAKRDQVSFRGLVPVVLWKVDLCGRTTERVAISDTPPLWSVRNG